MCGSIGFRKIIRISRIYSESERVKKPEGDRWSGYDGNGGNGGNGGDGGDIKRIGGLDGGDKERGGGDEDRDNNN